MNEASKRRLFAIGALAVAGVALAVVSVGNLGENLVYYWSPSELIEKQAQAGQATIRLGGMVVPGSMRFDKEVGELIFRLTDGTAEVDVLSTASPPQMFREGIGCVVEGEYGADSVFHTERIMVKHSNEYEAPENGHDVEELYKSIAVEES